MRLLSRTCISCNNILFKPHQFLDDSHRERRLSFFKTSIARIAPTSQHRPSRTSTSTTPAGSLRLRPSQRDSELHRLINKDQLSERSWDYARYGIDLFFIQSADISKAKTRLRSSLRVIQQRTRRRLGPRRRSILSWTSQLLIQSLGIMILRSAKPTLLGNTSCPCLTHGVVQRSRGKRKRSKPARGLALAN